MKETGLNTIVKTEVAAAVIQVFLKIFTEIVNGVSSSFDLVNLFQQPTNIKILKIIFFENTFCEVLNLTTTIKLSDCFITLISYLNFIS